MKKIFLLTLFSTCGLVYLSLHGAVFNKTLAHFNTNAVSNLKIDIDTTEHKCRTNHPNNTLPYQIKTIVIDAGHGGHDPGCSGPNSVEKHLALAIAKKFAAVLEAKYPELEVILTRDKDVFIPLYERAAIANRAKADLFVSIHCNALPSSKATWGSETYVMGLHTADHNLDVAKRENDAILLEADYQKNYDYDPNSPEGHILLSMYQNAFLEQSIQFAERVEYHFHATAQRRSRGVKQAGFVVLKETAMPSALVEVGFLTSAKDENFFKTEEGQEAASSALLNAFRDYKILVEEDGTGDVATHFDYQNQLEPAPKAEYIAPKGSAVTPPPSQPVVYTAPSVPNRVQAEQVINRPNLTLQSTRSTPIPIRERSAQPQAAAIKNMNFSVQLAAAPQPLNTRLAPWTNVDQLIEVIQENRLFKYQIKNLKTLEQAFETRLQLQSNGFTDAFIVCYRNGLRITMEEARRILE